MQSWRKGGTFVKENKGINNKVLLISKGIIINNNTRDRGKNSSCSGKNNRCSHKKEKKNQLNQFLRSCL